jgi:pimeloyl-ACP methyl ester carboxylesterase
MEKFFLTEIETKDNLVLHGLYMSPRKKRDIALLWIHGLSGEFYGNLPVHEAFAKACEKRGWGYAAFNNRGHSLISGIHKRDPQEAKGYSYFSAGAGMEHFEDCICDIDAGIDFLIRQGFKKIYLVGHSTGSNKACYYAGKTRDPRLGGVVLTGPISDRLMEEKSNRHLGKSLSFMKKKIKEGKGSQLFFGHHFFPITPKRFVSLFERGQTEDVFDYGEHPVMKYYQCIRIPLYVVIGEYDEYADRPVQDIKRVFDRLSHSEKYGSYLIPAAIHGFDGKESILVRKIVDWIVHT